MSFFTLDITSMDGVTQRHIVEPSEDGSVKSWPLTDDNPNKPALDEWLAKGNKLTEYNPESEPPLE